MIAQIAGSRQSVRSLRILFTNPDNHFVTMLGITR